MLAWSFVKLCLSLCSTPRVPPEESREFVEASLPWKVLNSSICLLIAVSRLESTIYFSTILLSLAEFPIQEKSPGKSYGVQGSLPLYLPFHWTIIDSLQWEPNSFIGFCSFLRLPRLLICQIHNYYPWNSQYLSW